MSARLVFFPFFSVSQFCDLYTKFTYMYKCQARDRHEEQCDYENDIVAVCIKLLFLKF